MKDFKKILKIKIQFILRRQIANKFLIIKKIVKIENKSIRKVNKKVHKKVI